MIRPPLEYKPVDKGCWISVYLIGDSDIPWWRDDYPVCYRYCLLCMRLQLKSLQNSWSLNSPNVPINTLQNWWLPCLLSVLLVMHAFTTKIASKPLITEHP
jgi:hypothetical protein